jgi:hypothetical protein
LNESGGKVGPEETGYAAIAAEAEKRVVANNATCFAWATREKRAICDFENLASHSRKDETAPIDLKTRISYTPPKGGFSADSAVLVS